MRELVRDLATSLFAFVLTMGMSFNAARAEKMDSETHTLVIEKMERVLAVGKEDETLHLRPVRARLADLYAERARLRAMTEAEKGCQNCMGSLDDRKRAIALYEVIIKTSSNVEKGPVLIQMAHLNDLIGQKAKSVRIYEDVIRGGARVYGKKVTSLGYTGLAEAQFSKGQFKAALGNFVAADKLAEPSKRGYIAYRIAWCQLNMGDQVKAVRSLVKLLETPEFLTRESTTGPVHDDSFHEDISRDLATFLARGTLGASEIRLLDSLSPERAKRDNLHHLASEAERLGNRDGALEAWAVFLEHETKPTDRLEAMVRVAQIRFDLGQKDRALEGMGRAVETWKKQGCKEDRSDDKGGDKNDGESKCLSLRMRLRKLVIDWNRMEKKKPSPMLLEAYQVYLSKFDDDVEMSAWAALVARETKQSRVAAALYHKTSLLAAASLAGKRPLNPAEKEYTAKDAQATQEILEGALVSEIEMAELSDKLADKTDKTKPRREGEIDTRALREAAYDHYLKLNPQGKMAAKVRYQRAHVAYERGDHKTALDRFDDFVSSSICQKPPTTEAADLCVKAADLALDTLVLLKDETAIEKHALKYAVIVPSRRVEYTKIARKSVLNQVARVNNDPQSSSSEVQRALEKLSRVNLAGASREETLTYHKNRLMLAEKARDLRETDRAADGLLAMKDLSAQDREYALSRKVWAAEMALEFPRAYSIALKCGMPELSREERALRLALLAELAGHNPRPHEEDYLSISHDRTKAALVRAKMVRSSHHPLAEIRKYEAHLARVPAVYAPLALEIFARTGDVGFAERVLRDRRIMREPAGAALARHLFLRDFASVQNRLARHGISSRSDALLARTLTSRVQLLGQAEQAAAQAIRSGDVLLQMVTLSVLAKENLRLHDEIIALPAPAKLKGPAREKYLKLVATKAQPYQVKHDEINAKLAVLWKDDAAIEAIAEDFTRVRRELKPVLAKDLRVVAGVAPSGPRRRIEKALASDDERPSQGALVAARREVKEGPFNARRLATLKELEEKNGGETMVAYLDARILKLREQGEKR